jgi:hypothetical protein
MTSTAIEGEARTRRRSRLWLRVLVVLIVLVGLASALMAEVASLVDRVTPTGEAPVDLCGIPLSGFYQFWDRFGWLCLAGLGLIVAIGSLALTLAFARGKHGIAIALVVVTLGLSPIPWAIQGQRQSEPTGCHQL